MVLKRLELQNFRNYTKSAFHFHPYTSMIVGANASGKSNLLEAVWLLSTGRGKGFEKEQQFLRFNTTLCRVKGTIGLEASDNDDTALEIAFSQASQTFFQKKYLINGVPKRRADFAGNLTAVLFTPVDLEIVIGSPGNRRHFLDEVLEQTDREYRMSIDQYGKALRQRNALLERVQESGKRNQELFAYWDDILIQNGQLITRKREELIAYIDGQEKQFFPFTLQYDKSEISHERLEKYMAAEVGAGVTLVGPHRDDVFIRAMHPVSKKEADVKFFSSRGQQRLVVLELRLSQISYIEMRTGEKPLLLLDDIFSELDSQHIVQVLQLNNEYQTIITTTHEEFLERRLAPEASVIKLGM